MLTGYTKYKLPNVGSASGPFALYIYTTMPGVTVPIVQTVKALGDKTSIVDVTPVSQEAPTTQFDIVDDTSIYPGGFWFNLCAYPTYVRLMKIEGAAEEFYFFGKIEAAQSEFMDVYSSSDGSTLVRTATISLTSAIYNLMEANFGQLLQEIELRAAVSVGAPIEGELHSVISIADVFSCALIVSGLNDYDPEYFHTDATISLDASHPNILYYAQMNFTVDKLVLPVTWWNAGSASTALNVIGQTTLEYLSQLLSDFQLVMQLGYDSVNDRALVKLSQKCRVSSATVVTPERMHRRIWPSTDNILTSLQMVDALDSSKTAWISTTTNMSLEAPGDSFRPDAKRVTGFLSSLSPGANHVADRLVIGSVSYPSESPIWAGYIRSGSFYHFKTGSMVNSLSANYAIGELACGSLFSRYGNGDQTIEETYCGITASIDSGLTFSVENAAPLMQKRINDGRVTQMYFAQRVIQKPSVNQMVVTWIKE